MLFTATPCLFYCLLGHHHNYHHLTTSFCPSRLISRKTNTWILYLNLALKKNTTQRLVQLQKLSQMASSLTFQYFTNPSCSATGVPFKCLGILYSKNRSSMQKYCPFYFSSLHYLELYIQHSNLSISSKRYHLLLTQSLLSDKSPTT